MWQPARKDIKLMGAPRAPYMAKTDKERLATGFWNRIESNQAADCNKEPRNDCILPRLPRRGKKKLESPANLTAK